MVNLQHFGLICASELQQSAVWRSSLWAGPSDVTPFEYLLHSDQKLFCLYMADDDASFRASQEACTRVLGRER